MEITSFYIFHISPKKRYNAMVKMAYAAQIFRRAKGCKFAKVMGSGGGTLGFGLMPNFGIYAAILVWQSWDELKKFEDSNHLFLNYQKNCSGIQKFYGQPYKVHGKWDGKEPFSAIEKTSFSDNKVIVLTRARIKIWHVLRFWKFVPKTSDALLRIKGRIFSIGVGELPLLFQATISIWESHEHMREYAYGNKEHIEVIKRTKEYNWYSEELFARFHLIDKNF